MSGRLNKVDVDSDLILLLIHDSGGLTRSKLWDKVRKVNFEPFQFDAIEDYGEFMDNLEMFDVIGFFRKYSKGEKIILNDKGTKMAEKLKSHLTEEQKKAMFR